MDPFLFAQVKSLLYSIGVFIAVLFLLWLLWKD